MKKSESIYLYRVVIESEGETFIVVVASLEDDKSGDDWPETWERAEYAALRSLSHRIPVTAETSITEVHRKRMKVGDTLACFGAHLVHDDDPEPTVESDERGGIVVTQQTPFDSDGR